MAVDETSLERIRKATFPAARRGYDKREVEKFLNRLADWLETGGGDQDHSDTVRRELERAGQRTGVILAEAEESAEQIRAAAEREMAQLAADAATDADMARTDADSYAAEARASADNYSKETRSAADAAAEQTRKLGAEDARAAIDAAEAHARRLVDEGVMRRKDIESVIGDLAGRRDQAIAGLEDLRLAVDRAIGEHKPSGADRFAPIDELALIEDLAGDEDGEALAVANAGDAGAEEPEPDGFEEFEDEPAADGAEAAVEAEDKPKPAKKRSSRSRKTASSKGKR